MDSEIDVELLINQVKQYPEVWKTTSGEFWDKIKKNAAWFKICEAFFANFNEKSEVEKNELGKKLLNKWKNIRDQFMKNVRKRTRPGQGPTLRRHYMYSKQLSFLLEAEERAIRQSRDWAVIEPEPRTGKRPTSGARCEDAPEPRPHKDLEASLVHFMNALTPSAAPDEYKSFFESLIPTIKTFNIDQKLEFRTEILNVVKQIRSAFPVPPHQTLPPYGFTIHQRSFPQRPQLSHSISHQSSSLPAGPQFQQTQRKQTKKPSARTARRLAKSYLAPEPSKIQTPDRRGSVEDSKDLLN